MKRIPYYSQWGSAEHCEQVVLAGADPCAWESWYRWGLSPDDYRFWSRRACGLVCFTMILDAHVAKRPRMADLLDDAITHGAYRLEPDGSITGLIYQPFKEWVEYRYNPLTVEIVTSASARHFFESVEVDSYALLSVSSRIRWAPQAAPTRGGHLILAFSDDAGEVRFHNPSGFPGSAEGIKHPPNVVEEYFSGRGMLLRWRDESCG